LIPAGDPNARTLVTVLSAVGPRQAEESRLRAHADDRAPSARRA